MRLKHNIIRIRTILDYLSQDDDIFLDIENTSNWLSKKKIIQFDKFIKYQSIDIIENHISDSINNLDIIAYKLVSSTIIFLNMYIRTMNPKSYRYVKFNFGESNFTLLEYMILDRYLHYLYDYVFKKLKNFYPLLKMKITRYGTIIKFKFSNH